VRRRVVVVSGPVAGGKSQLARRLARRFDGRRFSTRELLIADRAPTDPLLTRAELQALGARLDAETNGEWVADRLGVAAFRATESLFIIDAARLQIQVDALRGAFGREVTHLHVTAKRETCAARFEERRDHADVDEPASYADVMDDPTEAAVDDLAAQADIVIDTDLCGGEDVFVRAAGYLQLLDCGHEPCVDVLIGGSYGSEGKGNIAYHLAPEYDLLVRVGGPNAAHTVHLDTGEKFVHTSLPSGTRAGRDPAQVLVGAGAVVDLPELLTEISRSDITAERLTIDPHVMLIQESDKEDEKKLVTLVGSTGSGTGYATSRRLLRLEGVVLARDVPELEPYIRPGVDVLEHAYRTRQRIFLEGTQGAGLSLHHGPYPYTTSRDTNVAGCLAEAGIAPARVRRTILTVRSYPIRVGGNSGELRQELTWEDIAQRSNIPAEILKEKELTTKTKRLRRVAEFEWGLLRRAAVINAPTDIALTFADYIDADNAKAWRFEQLTPETLQFIDEMERVTGARVSLIATGFMPNRGIVDRREWT
jgi:adenylosuccinate synthase